MNRWLVVSVGAAVLIAGVFVAWGHWTPLLRYRAQRHYGLVRNEFKRYLDGRSSLEDAKTRVVYLLRHPPNLGDYHEDPSPGGFSEPNAGSLTSLNLIVTPSGYSPTDPKVDQLLEAVMDDFMPRRLPPRAP
jgi:hypothetical protein